MVTMTMIQHVHVHLTAEMLVTHYEPTGQSYRCSRCPKLLEGLLFITDLCF